MDDSRLYSVVGPHPDGWPTLAAQSFRDRMLDTESVFPCIFGVDATRRGTLRFAFIPAGPTRHLELAAALNEFANTAREVGARPSLVCFFEHVERLRSLDDYREHFWSLLQWLHKEDQAAWPPEISTDPEDPTWEFSFAGVPFFVVVGTPTHESRRSRHADWFTIAFQPRFAFDTLGPKQDANARTIIRARLTDYDEIAPSPALGTYGNGREWTQYFLEDDNEPPSGSCPMHS